MVRQNHYPMSMTWDSFPVAMATELLEDLWHNQSVWSQTADRMKNGIARTRLAALYIVVAVAVCGTLSGAVANPQPAMSRVLAAAAAFGAASLPLLRPRWSGRALQDWTRARSVSEALKSEIYLHLGRVGRYGDDPDGALLRTRTDRVRQDGNDLLEHQLGIKAAQRDLPAVQDIASYFSVRVTGQIDGYYTVKARELRTRIRLFRGIETVLAVIGAALGAIAAAVGGGSVAPWIAVVTTLGTAVGVHVAATRYDYQLIEFLRTADRLDQLRSQAAAPGVTPRKLNWLARSAEQVISIQNEGWMAKLAQEPPNYNTNGGTK